MRWFVSFMTYVDPRGLPSSVTFRGWEPGNAVIGEHPAEWARKTPTARLLFWAPMPDEPSPEERLAKAFRTEETVIAGLKALKEAGVQVPWSAMCVAVKAMTDKASEVAGRPQSTLDEEMRARIDAHSGKLMLEAAPQLRALEDAARITAEDLSTRTGPPSECEISGGNCPMRRNPGSSADACCDRNANRQPRGCPKERA